MTLTVYIKLKYYINGNAYLITSNVFLYAKAKVTFTLMTFFPTPEHGHVDLPH